MPLILALMFNSASLISWFVLHRRESRAKVSSKHLLLLKWPEQQPVSLSRSLVDDSYPLVSIDNSLEL